MHGVDDDDSDRSYNDFENACCSTNTILQIIDCDDVGAVQTSLSNP